MKKATIISLSIVTTLGIGILFMSNQTIDNNSVMNTLEPETTIEVIDIQPEITTIAEPPVETVIMPIIEDQPVIISEETKQAYIQEKYKEFCTYFFQHSTMVQVWFNTYFYSNPEQFTYELVDINLEKAKNHFIDMTQKTRYPEVVERGKSLSL